MRHPKPNSYQPANDKKSTNMLMQSNIGIIFAFNKVTIIICNRKEV